MIPEEQFTVETAMGKTPGVVSEKVGLELGKQAIQQREAALQEREAMLGAAEQELQMAAQQMMAPPQPQAVAGGLTGGVEMEVEQAITALENGANLAEVERAISPEAQAYLNKMIAEIS